MIDLDDLDLITKEVENKYKIEFATAEVRSEDYYILFFEYDVTNDDLWTIMDYLNEEYAQMLDDGRIEEFTKSEVDRTIEEVLTDYYREDGYMELEGDVQSFLEDNYDMEVDVYIAIIGENKMADFFWENHSIE